MTVITETYREQNRMLHASDEDYGAGLSTRAWYALIEKAIQAWNPKSILDYGCGKKRFGNTFPHYMVNGYDPAVEGDDASPDPAELVICLDVLEHIEPDCLDAVLDDLRRVVLKKGFFSIATGPSKRTLADGRNAHLIQKGPEWWLPTLMKRFRLESFQMREKGVPEFAVVVARLEP